MIDQSTEQILQTGAVGAMLVISVILLGYITKRFVDYLEKLVSLQEIERTEWRNTIDIHTDHSKDMYNETQQHHTWETKAHEEILIQLRQNTEVIKEMLISIKEENRKRSL